MTEDAWLESARSAFARRVAQRVIGMTDQREATRIIREEIARLLQDIGLDEEHDLDAMERLDDATYLGLAELDRLEQSED